MTRERSHKGSGRTKKKQPTHKQKNDRRQVAGTDKQIVESEEADEGTDLTNAQPPPGEASDR